MKRKKSSHFFFHYFHFFSLIINFSQIISLNVYFFQDENLFTSNNMFNHIYIK